MKWSKYNYMYESNKHGNLLFNFFTGVFLDINDPQTYAVILKLKNDPNFSISESDDDARKLLISSGILIEDDDNLKDMMDYSIMHERFEPKNRKLTILPTLGCNLTCTYCYEQSNQHKERMSPQVVEKIKEYIRNNYLHKVEMMHLQWFGGEPLMAFDIMEDITDYIKTLNIPFIGSIVTNGVLLTDEKIKKLKSLHIEDIQITLDGTKKTHNSKRIFKNGNGTYDIIMKNINSLHYYIKDKPRINVNIRVNVDKLNQDQYHIIWKEFHSLYPEMSVYPGILNQYQDCTQTLPCFTNHREEAEFYIKMYEQYGIVGDITNLSNQHRKNCMAEFAYTDMIGPRGEMYLCMRDVGDEKGVIGSIFTGRTNLPLISAYCSGNLTFNSPECRECDILSLCGGGCVNKKYRNKKFGEINYPCPPYKDREFLEHFLDIHYEIKKTTKNTRADEKI